MTLDRPRVRRWDDERDGEPTEERLRKLLEVVGDAPVVSLDATRS